MCRKTKYCERARRYNEIPAGMYYDMTRSIKKVNQRWPKSVFDTVCTQMDALQTKVHKA